MICPNCKREMRALFTSEFCPDAVAPDRFCSTPTVLIGTVHWRMQRVPADSPIPKWATRGWNLSGYQKHEDPKLSDQELAVLFAEEWSHEPGWSIEKQKSLHSDGFYYTSSYPTMVFAAVRE